MFIIGSIGILVSTSMPALQKLLCSLDVFPKLESMHSKKTFLGGLTSVVLLVSAFIIIILSLVQWSTPIEKNFFFVNQNIDNQIVLDFEVSVATKCDNLVILGRKIIQVEEITNLFTLEEENVWENADGTVESGCRIIGRSVQLSRAIEQIAITPLLGSLSAYTMFSDDLDPSLAEINFSHHFHHLFFDNNRDYDIPIKSIIEKSISFYETFNYFLSVYTTSSNNSVHSRYSLNGFKSRSDKNEKPGLVIHIDYEPIMMIEKIKKSDIFEILIVILGIIGGMFSSVSWIYGIVDCFNRYVFQKKQLLKNIEYHEMDSQEHIEKSFAIDTV